MNGFYAPGVYQGKMWPKIVDCYSRTWNEYQMPYHAHDRCELMYVVADQCVVICNGQDGDETAHKLGMGKYIFIDAGVPHRLIVEAGHACYIKNIEFDFIPVAEGIAMQTMLSSSPHLHRMIKRRNPVLVGDDVGGDMHKALDMLLDYHIYSLENPDVLPLENGAFAMLLHVLAYQSASERSAVGTTVHVRRALQYINEHYTENLCVAQIAGFVHIHPVYLQRLFRSAMQTSIVAYITQLRVKLAEQILVNNPDWPIVDIAAETGFNSRQHFARCFESLTGLSPSGFRRRAADATSRQLMIVAGKDDHTFDNH